MAAKKDRHEYAQRMRKVENLLMIGESSANIQDTISDEFDVSKRQVRKDCEKIRIEWKEAYNEDRPIKRAQLDKLLMKILRKCYSQNLMALSLKAVDQLRDLHGASGPIDMNIKIEDARQQEAKSSDKTRRFQQLMERAGHGTKDSGAPN